MKIVVTGGNGFIGRAVKTIAEKRNHEVISFDRSNNLDILDGEDLTRVFTPDVDAVIHLAGVLGTSELFDNLDEAIDVNVTGAANVLRATKMIDASYIGVTMPDVWPSLYQATKIAAQRMAEAFHNAYGLRVTHIRAFNAYGPGQAYGPGHPQKIVPTFATRAWHKEPIPIWGDGDQTVDLVHIDDIALRMVLAAEESEIGTREFCGSGQVWGAGSGEEVTVMDVARRVMRQTGSGLVEFLPMRAGELPGTKLCAKEFGPWTPDVVKATLISMGFDMLQVAESRRFERAVEYYKP